MRQMIDTTKNVIEIAKTYAYHKGHNETARKYRKSLELEKGKLDSQNIKLCKEYAKDVFGDEKYAPWLITYCTYSREFKEGWIPDNYYGEIVVPKMNGLYGKLSNRNAALFTLLKDADSLDICYYVNQLFLSTTYEVLDEKKLKQLLFSQNTKVVFKIENSRQGKGVYFFDENSFDIAIIKRLGAGVFQKYIEQHDYFSQFNKSSVATVRITSFYDDNGHIDVRAGYLKFGSQNDTHVISKTALYIHVDINNGKLGDRAYFADWTSTEKLPENDFHFAGEILPLFDVCLAKVKQLHSRIPYIRCIGWDIIVDKNDTVRIIELNGGHNGIIINEAFHGPCFKGLGWENLRQTN